VVAMKLYTIGFTQKTAQQFFELLSQHQVSCLLDIRLHPEGQLAGFTRKQDLPYFLRQLIRCDYRYLPQLAPTDEILKDYRSDMDWEKYQTAYLSLLDERKIPEILDRTLFEEKSCCLLCSEARPERCHRRLAAERLAAYWSDVEIVHL
jgi:uncharacterized protein (DUF488 family)